MRWRVEYTKAALKQLKKMGKSDSKRVLDWMDKNIDGCLNPHAHGKSLTGNRSGSGVIAWARLECLPIFTMMSLPLKCSRSGIGVRFMTVGNRRAVFSTRRFV